VFVCAETPARIYNFATLMSLLKYPSQKPQSAPASRLPPMPSASLSGLKNESRHIFAKPITAPLVGAHANASNQF
jgi:hypothetical protein